MAVKERMGRRGLKVREGRIGEEEARFLCGPFPSEDQRTWS
jgi:hypothetical protein